MENLRPIARREDIVVQEANNELLVYDLRNNKAHCLTETAAFIWNCCDGKNSIQQIRQKTEERFDSKVNEDFVLLALEELNREGLLETPIETGFAKISRREALRKVGVAAMIVLPLVASLSVPNTALATACCFGLPCTSSAQCTPPCTTCSGGTCI